MKNPMQELVKAAEAMLRHLDDDSFDPSFAGRTHRRREALRAAIPAALAYAERVGKVVEALLTRLDERFGDTISREVRDARALLASLDSAEVGDEYYEDRRAIATEDAFLKGVEWALSSIGWNPDCATGFYDRVCVALGYDPVVDEIPICRVQAYEDRGDPSVGLQGYRGTGLSDDQSGTVIEMLLLAVERSATAKETNDGL